MPWRPRENSRYGEEFDRNAAREHFDKYEVLAQKIGIGALKHIVPFSKEQIEKALASKDWHLNTLPLLCWDSCDPYVRRIAGRVVKLWSMSETVCVLKHVAKHHVCAEPRP